MGARDRKGPLTEKWRERIKTGVLIDRLVKHTAGELELSTTQIQAARILLNKTLPDLRATEHSMDEATTELVVSWRQPK